MMPGVGLDYLAMCCVFPMLVVGTLWAWARYPSFGAFAGSVSVAVVAAATCAASLRVARDVSRTDRLVGDALSPECGAPGRSFGDRERWPGLVTHAWPLTITEAEAADLSVPPFDGAMRPPISLDLRAIGASTIGTYSLDTARHVEAFEAAHGEIGPQEVVMVEIRGDVPASSLDRLHFGAHESLEVEWFWIAGDRLVLYRDVDGGTLELRDSALALVASATNTGALAEPIDSLAIDRAGGAWVALDREPPTLGHLTEAGQWTRTEVTSIGPTLDGLSSATDGGLCVWTNAERGAAHVEGDPPRAHGWPLAQVIVDRGIEQIAIVIAWIAVALSLRRLASVGRPWWAVRGGRVRVGELKDAGALWAEPGAPERALKPAAWFGAQRDGPAVVVDARVVASDPAYRESARETLHARWVVTGTRDEVVRWLRERWHRTLSFTGLVLLVIGGTAVFVAIAAVSGH